MRRVVGGGEAGGDGAAGRFGCAETHGRSPWRQRPRRCRACGPPACPLHRAGGVGKAPSPGVGKGAVRVCYHSPAGLTGAFLVTVRETVSSSTASAGSSLAITT